MQPPMKLHKAHHKIKTIDWQHWKHRSKNENIATSFDSFVLHTTQSKPAKLGMDGAKAGTGLRTQTVGCK